ncbi:MAG: T9SS type A sorting domain-containing protein [Bacteroidales bacterium]|nr:T9SS type A sorting domain-containing protein [Bacteroidales bacterium]
MKKTILSFSFIFTILISFAQTDTRLAPDFTAVTMDQDTVMLSDILSNQHQFVALEFFFTESQICQETANAVNDAYERMGCNDHDIVFLSVNMGNDSNQVRKYIDSLSLQNPIISGLEGGGSMIADSFNIVVFPTIILISPDTLFNDSTLVIDTIIDQDTTFIMIEDIYSYNVIEKDIWPVYTSDDIVDTLIGHGLAEYQCGPAGITDPMEKTAYSFQLYPNPNNGIFKIQSNSLEGHFIYQLIDLSGKAIYEDEIVLISHQEKAINLAWLKKGIYFLKLNNDSHFYTQKIIIQ